MNALPEDQTIVAHGKHFHFKANQVKAFQSDAIGTFILRERAELGFIEIPAMFNEEEGDIGDYNKDPKVIEERRQAGVDNYCAHLRKILYNLQVSLKKDLELKNLRMDPRTLATDSDLKHMEQLVRYQSKREDKEQLKIDRIKELEKKLEKV